MPAQPDSVHAFSSVWCQLAVAQTPAGDATASLAAVREQRHALTLNPDWGWIGALESNPSLFDLSCRVADPCWRLGQSLAPLPAQAPEPERWPGLVWSVSKGDTGAWLEAEQDRPKRFISEGLPGLLPARLARRWGQRHFHGAPPVGACASGLLALLSAGRLIDGRSCPWAIAGAADASLQDLLLGGFRSLGVTCGARLPLAHQGPGHQATGFAPAAGAAAFLLTPQPQSPEDWQLCGGLSLGDASHETRCDDPMSLHHLLLSLWQLCPDPELIVCHGTGTAAGDAIETQVLSQGPWAQVPRLCCKPAIGHSLGANGAVELAIALQGPWRRLSTKKDTHKFSWPMENAGPIPVICGSVGP